MRCKWFQAIWLFCISWKIQFSWAGKKFHYLKASEHVCNFRRSSTQNMLRRFPALHWNCTFNPFSKFHIQHNLSQEDCKRPQGYMLFQANRICFANWQVWTFSKSELLIFAECLPLCIYEVGWVRCALASRNKSPPCEVSDRLLGTLEKVQNNIGGNTGQSSSPRLWNTLINANKGWTWMICGARLPPKRHKMAIRQWPWNSGFFWGIAQEIYAFKHSLWILWFWWLWAHGRGGLGDVWEGSAVGVEEEI